MWIRKLPTAVAVPESVQLANVMPGGSEPVTVNVYEPTPPVHPKLMLNGTPRMAFGLADPPGMLSGAG